MRTKMAICDLPLRSQVEKEVDRTEDTGYPDHTWLFPDHIRHFLNKIFFIYLFEVELKIINTKTLFIIWNSIINKVYGAFLFSCYILYFFITAIKLLKSDLLDQWLIKIIYCGKSKIYSLKKIIPLMFLIAEHK